MDAWQPGHMAAQPVSSGAGRGRFGDFENEFTRRLLELEGNRTPYLFTFKRILMWAGF